jgi:plastocyanin
MIPTPARPAVCALALTALALIAGAGAAAAGNANVSVIGSTFNPATVTIQQGDSVTWTNMNVGIAHNVRADNGSFRCANGCDGEGGNGNPAANGWSFTRTFNAAGTIPYFCQIHGQVGGAGMSGTIVVQPGGGNPGTLRFSAATYSVGEGTAQRTITVQRVGGDDGSASVQYATSNGSAQAGSDYTAASGTLTWPAGNDDNRTFNVPILDDATPEGNETVNLTLSNAAGAGLGSPSSATLTITDNDSAGSPGTLSLTAAAQNVGEGDGSATVTVQRTGGTSGAVSADYSTADGSATGGLDYGPTSGTVDFANADAADKSFTIGVFDDASTEGDETVNVTLANPTGGAALGSPSAQTVTIVDDDIPPGPCVADDHTLCLHGDRFRVTVDFRAPGDTALRQANAIPFTVRAGMFWFFNEANVEMLLKVQNACVDPFNRWWVFYAATTNVEFTVTVVDTQPTPPRLKRYTNPQGQAAPPVQDTEAFATCP